MSCPSFFSFGRCASAQMTLSSARKSTTLAKPSPSSSMIVPASRASASATSTISWPPPAQPTLRGVDAQVGDRDLVDRLGLGGHDPLERRVAGLDHAGGHRDDRGQRALDVVVAGLGLALHLDGAAVDGDLLGEGHRRQRRAARRSARARRRCSRRRTRWRSGSGRPRRPARWPWPAPWRCPARRCRRAHRRSRGRPWPRPWRAPCADRPPRCWGPSRPG